MSLPVALPPGTIIGGHYIIGNLINSGGFGAVYRGTDTSEKNRPCAIKETYDVTPAARRQALMEASVLFTVRNSHLPEVYDALEANGRFYLIMQLVEGQNLLQVLKSRLLDGRVGESEPHRQPAGPCSEAEVLSWLLPIMDVLQELHSRNPSIIHRDIKPGNIILTPQRNSVLVDFGLTKLYDPARETQTMGKAVTEGFSPIEQYMGKTSPQSDVYSMAATMYLLLTNRLPPTAMHRTIRDELIAPRLLNPTLSVKTERALLKALAIHAQDRYQSMRAFAAALQEPAFTGYSDTTQAVPPPQISRPVQPSVQQNSIPGTVAANPRGTPPPLYPQAGLPPAYGISVEDGNQYQSGYDQHYYGVPAALPPGYPFVTPLPGQPGYPGQSNQPAQPTQAGKPVPPGKVAPTEPLKRGRSLPIPANQGCLWGLIQGVLGGLLMLAASQAGDIFLPVFVGLLFYVFAGFMTTRRGGTVLRGAWAGYYTGLIGIATFWLTFGIGLVINIIRKMQELSATSPFLKQHPDQALKQAWDSQHTVWPYVTLLAKQPLIVNVLAWLISGVFAAWLLGLLGGIIGTSHHRTRKEQQMQQKQAQAAPQAVQR